MKKVSERPQRTLERTAEVAGTGFLTGKHVRLRFRPAPANAGVVFVRVDLGPSSCIPARISEVTGTARRTTIGRGPVSVGLVEHVMAALSGLHIDNCYVELDAPEPPGMDGSAAAFVEALQTAGVKIQDAKKPVWAVDRTVVVRAEGATLALHPSDRSEFRVTYFLDYGFLSPIDRQLYTGLVDPATFAREIAPCRTFLLEEEAKMLREQGLGSRTTVTDLVIFDRNGPIDNKLLFGNEPARHKALDVVGDLALLGADLFGHVVAYRSGHPLNIELVRELAKASAPAASTRRLAA